MAGASPIPLVTVVVPVVSVSVLGMVVVVTRPLEERGDPVTWSHGGLRTERHGTPPSGPARPFISPCPDDTHLPIILLSVIVSVSVVLIISTIESIVVSPVSIVEVTVTLRKGEREGVTMHGSVASQSPASPHLK